MHVLKSIVLIITFGAVLTACGGSSGKDKISTTSSPPEISGGGSLLGLPDDIPEVTSFQPSVPTPRYNGRLEHSSLSRQNSFYFLEALYQLLEPVYEGGKTLLTPPKPSILNYSYESVVNSPCASGAPEHTSHSFDRRVTEVLTLDSCITDSGARIHGQILIDIYFGEDELPYSTRTTYRAVTIDLDGDQLTYHGQLTTTPDGGITVNFFTVYNAILDTVYHTEHLEIYQGSVNGRVYHSKWGYIDVIDNRSLSSDARLKGSNASQLDINLERDGQNSLLDLALSSPPVYGFTALKTSIPIDVLFQWPYRKNSMPEGELKTSYTVDLGDTLDLDAYSFTDPDHDFLTYQWRQRGNPEGCTELVFQTEPAIELSASCRGTHEFDLIVEDGFHTLVIPFSVIVAGPLPELAHIAPIEHTDRAQAISLNITVENETEAGPVTYALAYGPPGIEIKKNGTVSGIPQTLFQTQGGSVHFGVSVSNERTVIQDITINYVGREIEIRAENRGGFPADISSSWHDINQDNRREQLVDYGNTFAIIEVYEGVTRYRHLETREFSTFSLQDKGILDYDGDGKQDIVLVYSDKYVVLSGQDFRLIHEQELQPIITHNRPAVLVPGLNPGIYYQNTWETEEWSYYEFETGQRYPRVAPSTHELSLGNFKGDGHYSLLATSVEALDGNPAVLHTDGTMQRLNGYPSAVADINGDGVDDIIRVQSYTPVNETKIEHYSAATGELEATYTMNVPELDREPAVLIRFVNLDNDLGDELVLLTTYEPDQIYILKRSGTVFELARKIPYPERGDRTLFRVMNSLSQFDDNSAVIKGSAENGQLLKFSLVDDPIVYASGVNGYQHTSREPMGLYRVNQTQSNVEFLGIRRWVNEKGEARAVLTSNTLTPDLDWINHTYPNLPIPYDLNAITMLPSNEGARQRLVYAHGPSYYSVVNLEPEEVVTTGDAVVVNHAAGDLTGNGLMDIYGINYYELHKLNSQTYQYELIDDSLPSRGSEILGPTIAEFGGESPALFIPWNFHSSGDHPRMDVYQHGSSGTLQRTHTIHFETRRRDMGYAQQDVTGDGVPELIVWNTDENTSYWVIDASLTVISKGTTQIPLAGVLNLPGHSSNTLIAYKFGAGLGNWEDTRIVQIDVASGQVISRSPILPGTVAQDGLTCFGDNLSTCTKLVVTNLGVLSLK